MYQLSCKQIKMLTPSHLHISPAEVLHRLGTKVYLVSATNSRNVLRYAVPYLVHTTLGCKEVLVQFLSPCLVMFLLSWSEIGNPQYVYNIKAWDGDFISNFWGFIFRTPSRDLNLEVLLTVEKRLKGLVLRGSNNTLLTLSYISKYG